MESLHQLAGVLEGTRRVYRQLAPTAQLPPACCAPEAQCCCCVLWHRVPIHRVHVTVHVTVAPKLEVSKLEHSLPKHNRVNRITSRLNVPRNVAVLTVGEVADALRYTPEHVIGLIEAGQLKAFNFAVKTASRPNYRIPRSSFERLLRVKSNLYDATTGTELPERPLGRPVIAPGEFPIGVQSFTVAELSVRWGISEAALEELLKIESTKLPTIGNRIPFEAFRKWEQKRPAAPLTLKSGKKIITGRQCAAVVTPAKGQIGKMGLGKAKDGKAGDCRKKGGAR